jgi:hypothetical protein
MVERYLPGREVAVDGLVVHGEVRPLAVFEKPDPGDGPFFAETVLLQPARLSSDEYRDVLALTARVVAAVGLTDGPVHVEHRIDESGRVWFLELAPRSIGGLCSRALRPDGEPLEQLLVRAALGRALPTRLDLDGPATGVHMLAVPRPGVLEEVKGTDRAAAVSGITGVEVTMGPGAELVPLPEGDRYVGFVFAEAPASDDVEQALAAAVAELEVRVAPG